MRDYTYTTDLESTGRACVEALSVGSHLRADRSGLVQAAMVGAIEQDGDLAHLLYDLRVDDVDAIETHSDGSEEHEITIAIDLMYAVRKGDPKADVEAATRLMTRMMSALVHLDCNAWRTDGGPSTEWVQAGRRGGLWLKVSASMVVKAIWSPVALGDL